MFDRKQFLLDHISGLSNEELAEKYDLTPRSVAAKLMWAKEDIEVLQAEAQSPQEAIPSEPPSPKGKSRQEILALIGTPKDVAIVRQVQANTRRRIREHEAKIGRKDPGFRIQAELDGKKERLQKLGLTFNDIRRLRGVRI